MDINQLLNRYPIINREWVYVDCRGLADSMIEHFNDYVILNGRMIDLPMTCDIYKKECIRAYGGIWGHFVRRVDGNIGNLAIKNMDMWNRLFPRYMNSSGLYSDPYKSNSVNNNPAILCVHWTTVMGNSIYCLDMYDYRGSVYV
jgi:hypothetical protein